jgi:hypothetical protein
MSDSLSEEELADLIRHGRINTSRSAARRNVKKNSDQRRTTPQKQERAVSSTAGVSEKEPDPIWLREEKEKVERNVAASKQDKQRKDEMREASKF